MFAHALNADDERVCRIRRVVTVRGKNCDALALYEVTFLCGKVVFFNKQPTGTTPA